MGAIIGKGGATISALQQESGAIIRVTQQTEGDSRIVLLSGALDAVARAQQLVEEKLAEAVERRGGRDLGKKRPPPKPKRATESVPTFVDGQLVVVERPIEVDEVAAHAAEAEAPSEKRPKKLQRYADKDGEKTGYFRDDDAKDLKELYAEERRGGAGGKGIDGNTADAIARSKRYKGPVSADDEYDHDDGLEQSESRQSRQSAAKRARHEAQAAATAERRGVTSAQRADERFSSSRHLVVALGEHTYLRLQQLSPISPGHCVIEAIQQADCLTAAAEEVATEVRNFRKCLIRMAEAEGKQCVFMETYRPAHRPFMAVECVPLAERDASVVPAYFKKAILECDEEWSQHRKLYETQGCAIGVIPPSFAYFDVGFGLQSGYAHVIEDEAEWKVDFGRNVLEGILEHPDGGIPLARRRKPAPDALREAVADFTKRFEPFDWTRQLEG